MINSANPPSALRMAQDFDGEFAEAIAPPSKGEEAFLALSIAGHPYALRMSEIAGLMQRKVTWVPSRAEAFLGLSGVRGNLVPVWDLAALLGCGSSREGSRWLALGRDGLPWASAFENFEGYFSVGADQQRPFEGMGRAAPFVRMAVGKGGALRPVVHLATVFESIHSMSQAVGSGRSA